MPAPSAGDTRRGAPARYTILIATGAIIAVAWFFVLAALLWGLIMAFSFPVGLIWIAAAIASGMLVARLRPGVPTNATRRPESTS